MNQNRKSIVQMQLYINQKPRINSQTMSSQSKSQPDENQYPKKTKRQPTQENQQSLRKGKPKQEHTQQQNKITRYFAINNSATTPTQPVKIESQQPIDPSKVEELEEKVRLRERQIKELRDKKQSEDQRINNVLFQIRQFKNKTKPLIASTLLQIAEAKRQEKREKNKQFGHFTDNMRFFVEGEAILSIRRQLADKQAAIKKLQQISKAARGKTEEHTRTVSSLQFSQKEMSQLKKELQLVQKEVVFYKEKIKLAEKEKKSYYCLQGWPIIYDRYQTLELLGAGGFGQVYKCYDLDTNRLIAVKRIVFPERNRSQQQHFFRHVLRETQIQKSLKHPNIVRFQGILQSQKSQNLLVFELQYCSGPELSSYLRKYGCLQQREAKIIMKQLFSAVDYLSKLKEPIIHYDLKPSNIIFHEGIVKILDFGLSKIMSGDDSRMELTSQGVGTYWYLPPQTFKQNSPQISAKVDVWSLGIIFYQMLYGRKPFGHGVKQEDIFNNGIILKAFLVEFPVNTPRGFRVSQDAKNFIRESLKYSVYERLSPSQGNNHEYLQE